MHKENNAKLQSYKNLKQTLVLSASGFMSKPQNDLLLNFKITVCGKLCHPLYSRNSTVVVIILTLLWDMLYAGSI